jgi:cytochrome c oxidase subunit 2
VRPRPLAFAVALALGALAVAAPALAGNGGVAPTAPASENAEAIRSSYWLILAITGAAFIVVETLLVVFLVRYRGRGRARDVGGAQVGGHTRLEIAWTLVPVVLLAAITAFIFFQLPTIENAPAARPTNTLTVQVEGHQYYWLFRYPGGQIAIDNMVVPAGKVVNLEVTAPDVIHSWWIPALGGKIDAIPGRTNHTWFKATREGTFVGGCAELCGAEHALMTGSVQAVSQAEFDAFLASHSPSSRTVGKETFEGVCAKCHGMQGQGTEAAPAIAGRDFDATTTILLRNGGVRMPAVGKDWSQEQVNAALAYLNSTIGRAAQGGG